MLKRLFFIVSVFLKTSLFGQCPDKEALRHRLIFLRDSTTVKPSDQLTELRGYLDKMNDCSHPEDSVYTLLMARIGWLYFLQKDYPKAILLTNKSIDVIHSNAQKTGIKVEQLVKFYHNLSVFYDSSGQLKLKIQAMDSCISVSVRLEFGYDYSLQHIYDELIYHFDKGDYYSCLNYAIIGEDITRKSGYLTEDIFFYISWKLNAFLSLNKYAEAEQLANKSIQECKRKGIKKYLGSLYGIKANIAEEQGNVSDAIHFAKQSLFYDNQIKNYSGCYGTLNNLGYKLYFVKLQQNEEALHYYFKALKYANTNDSISTLNNIANLYVRVNLYDSAFYFFKQAYNIIGLGNNETDIPSQNLEYILNKFNVEYLSTLILDKAEACIFMNKYSGNSLYIQKALLTYKMAVRMMEKIKLTQSELSTKLFWRFNTRRLYEHAIESCYLLGNMEDAFYFFEKSRAVLLNDQLKEQETGDPLMQEMAIAKKRVLILEKQNANLVPSSPEYSRVQRELFINKEQISRLDQEIKAKNPWYYQSLIDTNFISLHEVKSKLLGNKGAKAFMEFFNGDSSVYVLTVTAGNSKVSRIRKTDFENAVNSYIRYVSNSTMENQDYAGFINTGRLLYSLIFKDAPVPDGRIIISPDGKYFPLEALITNQNNPTPEYFLNSHIISYTYSIRYLLNDFTKKSSSSTGNFLGMAPVQYPEAFQLASLSRSDASLEKISLNFKDPELKIGPQATRSQFMRLFQNFKIIQLYTHASDSSSNDEPVIYFADSGLYLSELIPENKTAAQLIVLSACETGNGKLYKGEGVFSFNRGFAALGIPSSVINLWSVDDESTYKLTELFYKYVRKGLPLDEALQKAKLDFFTSSSKEKKLPYFWAATILAGMTDPILTTHGIPWGLIVDFGLIGLFVFGFILVKRKSKKSKTPDHFQHSII